MAAVGFRGGPSRCFAAWQDFQKCYLDAKTSQDCIGPKDDYYECLFHKKEVERAVAVHKEYVRQLEERGEKPPSGRQGFLETVNERLKK